MSTLPPSPPAPSPPASPEAPLDLHCPLCDYNLQGLPEPRCPECGHQFEWAELTDPARQKLPWFFEHRRWLGGYLSTQVKLLLHFRFWRIVRPSHRLHIGRVVRFYLLALFALTFVIVLLGLVDAGLTLHRQSSSYRPFYTRPVPQSQMQFSGKPLTQADLAAQGTGLTAQQWLDRHFPLYGSPTFPRAAYENWVNLRGPGLAALFWGVIPGAVGLLVLGIMRQSFSRARIRPGHAVRVALYSADPLPFLLGTAIVAGLGLYQLTVNGRYASLVDRDPFLAVACCAWLVWLLRLEAGVRKYLGVPRAWAISIVAGAMAAMLGLLAWLDMVGFPF